MSEKFNPLAEAEANASQDRRRFYDWVGNDSDHTDSESFRTANEDTADYLRSRDYEDDNGSLHNAKNGRFISNPNTETEDTYYSRMVEESGSEVDTRFAGKSLTEVAELIRDARANDDVTTETDARAVFDEKFIEMAEKYGWEGVVEKADGSLEDRNEIADKRLAHYESIMENTAEDDKSTSEAPTESNTTEEGHSESEVGSDATVATSEKSPESDGNETDNAEEETADEIEESDEERIPAKEGESWEEYKGRTGVVGEIELDDDDESNETEDSDEADDDDIGKRVVGKIELDDDDDDESNETEDSDEAKEDGDENEADDTKEADTSKKTRWYHWLTPSGVTGYLAARSNQRAAEREGGENSPSRTRKWLGRTAFFAAGLGVGYLAFKGNSVEGIDVGATPQGSEAENTDTLAGAFGDAAKETQTSIAAGVEDVQSKLGEAFDAHEAESATGGSEDGENGGETTPGYSEAAGRVDQGEGWHQTFEELGIPKSEWSSLLERVGPELGEMRYSDGMQVAYFETKGGVNEWRIYMPADGKMPTEVLDTIMAARN